MNNFNSSKPTRLSKVCFSVRCYRIVLTIFNTGLLYLGHPWLWQCGVVSLFVACHRGAGYSEQNWDQHLPHHETRSGPNEQYHCEYPVRYAIYLYWIVHLQVQDVGAERDAITSLRAPTHFGRPNWDRVFSSIAEKHPETDVGVFFCGPTALSKMLHVQSNKYSTPDGTRFYFGKGSLRFCLYIYLRWRLCADRELLICFWVVCGLIRAGSPLLFFAFLSIFLLLLHRSNLLI